MKKFLSVLTISAFLFTAPMAFAGDCKGDECYQKGKIDMSVFAAGGDIDGGFDTIPNGIAGGAAAAGGIGAGQAKGGSFLGKVEGNLSVTAGGIIDGNSYDFHPGIGDKSIGIGTWGHGEAAAGGHLDLKAYGFSAAEGTFGAVAGQATLGGSLIGPSPKYGWDSNGFSFGVSGQLAGGYVEGGAFAVMFGNAEADGQIYMIGNNYSESYRAIDWLGGGYKTEYMGTNVGADTTVFASGYDRDCGLSYGYVDGGYIAAGGAKSMTVQAVEGGIGIAKTTGFYAGKGNLNCDFQGTANGYTQTSITTLKGGSGSIVTSSAGMSVSVGTPQQN